MNDVTVAITNGSAVYCANCGHRADVLREECDCRKCAETERLKMIRDKQRDAKEG
jgi:hypothetical protein